MRHYFGKAAYHLADMRETARTRRSLQTLRIPPAARDRDTVTAICLIKDEMDMDPSM